MEDQTHTELMAMVNEGHVNAKIGGLAYTQNISHSYSRIFLES